MQVLNEDNTVIYQDMQVSFGKKIRRDGFNLIEVNVLPALKHLVSNFCCVFNHV